MATYKVLQDIEAEDTLIGPLTVRQCLYAAIAAVAGYLIFISIVKHAAFLVIFLLPIFAFGAFFAFPWSKQQPTEIWALAKVRFYFKPRKRIWNQSGVKELVTITVPKVAKQTYTSNLSPTEVKSRLKALADTIDSRGWAVKNVDLGYYAQPSILGPGGNSDRLVDASSLQQDVPNYNASAAADIFDVRNNPVAQKFDVMMSQSADMHRQQLMQQMSQQQAVAAPQSAGQPALPAMAPAPSDYWHMSAAQQPQPPVQTAAPLPVSTAAAAAPPAGQGSDLILNDEAAIAQQMQAPAAVPPADYSGIRTQSVQVAAPASAAPANSTQTPVTATPNPAILELANNNDLDIATIAREAQARNPDPPDEVVISLH